MLTPEQAVENFGRVQSLCEQRLTGLKQTGARTLLNELGERLITCPQNGRIEQGNAFAGGLIDHALRVLKYAALHTKHLPRTDETEITAESLTLVCLFREIGKVGDHEHPLYVPQESQWHREKLGEMFTFNKALTKRPIPLRSVWLLQHFELPLTSEEFGSICPAAALLPEGETHRWLHEPELGLIVSHADLLATRWEMAHPNVSER